MSERSRILVVDDESQITRVLRTTLSSNGYDVRTAADAESALEVFGDWKPDLVITDLNMPGMTGVDLCKALRKKSEVPVIVLSVKGEERTKIEALDSGADDYVTKPFSSAELLARIRSNLRRAPAAPEATFEMGDFFIDFDARIVRVKKKDVHLTPKEYELLTFMAKKPGKVLSHRELLAAVWGGDSVHQPEYLRVFVNQLRNKIEPSDNPRYILTEPWIGYRFQPSPELAG
jgi:two-component system KDP operon response regulator KdpE